MDKKDIINKVYDPHAIEKKWHDEWLKQGYLNADSSSSKKPYCIVIPPPNVTGALHMGHALNNTLQDILIRWKRMDGYNALWMPGMDHAGIATQNVVEKMLARDGVNRFDLGREKFVEQVWDWKEKSGGVILNQLKRLGASCDWRRERFTMDEGLSRAVREVFVRLFKEGLIYKGDRLINWCPRCHTALSDLEVEHQDQDGSLVYIKYPVNNSDGKSIIVATTRPETMLGDSAIAVNPDDERFTSLIGQSVILPLTTREIPIISDKYVDKDFGTGALKITPAHDFNDFDIGSRHNLPVLKVINEQGAMNREAGEYAGLDRFDCRKKIIKDLKDLALLEKEEPYNHSVGKCYRCHTVLEPNLSKQWFVKIKPLAEPAIKAVREKRVQILPETWENTYFAWMENINDWCISRQIWWGHQVPAWLCEDCGEFTVEIKDPDKCGHCGSSKIQQESDVLDTWFSSALWPFSTLGWPDKTKDLALFYPTDVLVTGLDILFFWVARMIMMGLKFMGDVPFKKVYIHALIRDSSGQKMSKSKGNIIDPLTIIDKFGVDAFRFTLAALAAQGRDIKLSEDRIEGYRNFVNKIWNGFRFTSTNLEGCHSLPDHAALLSKELQLSDRWILSRLQNAITDMRKGLEEFRFNDCAHAVYKFFWHELCDWYLELIKSRLQSDGEDKATAQAVLLFVFDKSLKLLHPIMPFITEELWQKLPGTGETITLSQLPQVESDLINESVESAVNVMMDICRCIRNIRSEMNISPGQRLRTIIRLDYSDKREIIDKQIRSIKELAKLDSLDVQIGGDAPKLSASAVSGEFEIYVLLEGVLDLNEEVARLKKEIAKIKKETDFFNKKLSNDSFVAKAPADVVEKCKDKLATFKIKHEKLQKNIDRITGMM